VAQTLLAVNYGENMPEYALLCGDIVLMTSINVCWKEHIL